MQKISFKFTTIKNIIGGIIIDKKYTYILIIIIIAIIGIVGVYMSGLTINNEKISDSSNWQVKELAGIKFKLPEKYSSGILLSGNIIDGVETGNTYQSNEGGLFIRIVLSSENSDEIDKEYGRYMESNSSTETFNISGHEVTVAHNDTNPQPFSIAFFEVNGNKIAMKWDELHIDGDIKAIIASFYELNK
jgi:hypothetical protein